MCVLVAAKKDHNIFLFLGVIELLGASCYGRDYGNSTVTFLTVYTAQLPMFVAYPSSSPATKTVNDRQY